MPSHGPTEPPDESHGWEDEYDRIMETPAGKAFLADLWRMTGAVLRGGSMADTYDAVETDDDALQAFVQEVYDRGVAHGVGVVRDEQAHAALAVELEEQDKMLDAAQEWVEGPREDVEPFVLARVTSVKVTDQTYDHGYFDGATTCRCGDPNCKVTL